MASCKKCKVSIEAGHSYCSVCLNDPAPIRPKSYVRSSSSEPKIEGKPRSFQSKVLVMVVLITCILATLAIYKIFFRHITQQSHNVQVPAISAPQAPKEIAHPESNDAKGRP